MITLTLELHEVNVILQTLGNLPTSSNVWPLAQKIQEQAAPQVPTAKEA